MKRKGAAPAKSRKTRLVAVVSGKGRFAVAESLFEPGISLSLGKGKQQPRNGEMVLVESDGMRARVLRQLGSPHNAADVINALLWQRGIDRGFTRAVEAEANTVKASSAAPDLPRRDLTELATFTVDPASAHDFDDAVSAQPDGDGMRLWIHIADVAAYVRPGGALDNEALRRGNSVYVPGTVEPMLPTQLSNEACSLAPGVVRLAVTTEIRLSATGEPVSTSFYRSRMRSAARLNYDQLDRIFAGVEQPPDEVRQPLEVARRAAALLTKRRSGTALAVETAEPDFEFDAEGNVVGAVGVPQTESHRLIEQLMVLTNERVAEYTEKHGLATIYRVHELPDTERVRFAFDQLASLGVPTPALPDNPAPIQAATILADASRMVGQEAEIRGNGREGFTVLILRSLKQARYSPENLGHAGLDSAAYSHFTSPIRRYPDLVAHRALLAQLGEGETAPTAAEVAEAAVESSDREREAMSVERYGDRICGAFLLERELAQSDPLRLFEGEVSGFNPAGVYVRFEGDLADIYEGFLPARTIGGRERFELNEMETAMVGGRHGRAIRLGDPIPVRVSGIETARGRVDLEPFPGSENDG